MIRPSLTAVGVFLLLTACAGGGSAPEPTESGPPAPPAATTTKEPRQSPTHEATPSPAGGTPDVDAGLIRGQVCYPSEYVPEMTAFFQDTTSGKATTLDIAENQASYEVTLPAGTYLVFAYLVGTPTLGGAYTAAVPCGLDASCTDHTPLPVTVAAGQTLEGIDLCDWYDQGALPPNPQD